MCLIAFKRNDKEDYKEDYFKLAADNNRHGTGIMYPKDGRIVHKKVGVVTDAINKELYDEFAAQPIAAIHVRIKTHGDTNDFNAHPFCILDKDTDGMDLYMMHNGIIGNVDIVDKGKSDTWHFVNLYLKPLLMNDPYLLTNPYFGQIVEKFIGSSRLVFMYGDGTYVIIGDSQGHTSTADIGGCWLSNRSNSYLRTPTPSYANSEYWKGNANYASKADTHSKVAEAAEKPAVAPLVVSKVNTPAFNIKQDVGKASYKEVLLSQEEKVAKAAKLVVDNTKLPVTDSNQAPEHLVDIDDDTDEYTDAWKMSDDIRDYYPAEKDDDKHNLRFFDQRTLFAQAVTTDEILDSLVKQTQSQVINMLEDEEVVQDLVFSLIDLHTDKLLQESA